MVALAEHHQLDTKRSHRLKADAASEFYKQGALFTDYGPLLRGLNQARKDIWYEGEEADLDAEIEAIAQEVQELVNQAWSLP